MPFSYNLFGLRLFGLFLVDSTRGVCLVVLIKFFVYIFVVWTNFWRQKGVSSSIIVSFKKTGSNFCSSILIILVHYYLFKPFASGPSNYCECNFFHIRHLLSLSFILKGMKLLVLDRTSKSRGVVVVLSFKDIEGRFSNFGEELVRRPCRDQSD